MKKSRKILFAVIYFIFIFLMFNCTLFTDKELGSFLEGKWEGDISGGFTGNAKMTFNDDNSGKLELSDSSTVKNDFICTKGDSKSITLDFDDWSASDGKYSYKMSGDSLIIYHFIFFNGLNTYDLKLDMKRN